MPVRFIQRCDGGPASSTGSHAGIAVDSSDSDKLKIRTGDGVKTVTYSDDVVDLASATIEDVTVQGASTVDLSNAAAVFIAPQATSPAQTAEGSVVWDSDSDLLTVGDGASRKTMVDLATAQTLVGKTLTSPVINTPTVTDLTEVVSATNVIAATETGSVFFLSSATEFVSTLPDPAAGLKFTFIVTAAPVGADYTIVTTGGTDLIHGVAVSAADAGGSVDSTGGTPADTISFVDGQAQVGDRVDVVSDGTNWYAIGFCADEDAITFTAS